MPITRRRRANPPDQPENNNHLVEQNGDLAESLPAESAPDALVGGEVPPASPSEPEGQQEKSERPTRAHRTTRAERLERQEHLEPGEDTGVSPQPPSYNNGYPSFNGEYAERQEHPPVIEGGRRTVRGEFFRRPPQIPQPQQVQQPQPLQAPTHEIKLPLGKDSILHLAYNPSYTGAEEARDTFLRGLMEETKAGGRARCWNCGSIGVAYDRWNTRSKTFGEIGIAYCEICGVWSVM